MFSLLVKIPVPMHRHLERPLDRPTAQHQTKITGSVGNGILNRLVRAGLRQTTKATNS